MTRETVIFTIISLALLQEICVAATQQNNIIEKVDFQNDNSVLVLPDLFKIDQNPDRIAPDNTNAGTDESKEPTLIPDIQTENKTELVPTVPRNLEVYQRDWQNFKPQGTIDKNELIREVSNFLLTYLTNIENGSPQVNKYRPPNDKHDYSEINQIIGVHKIYPETTSMAQANSNNNNDINFYVPDIPGDNINGIHDLNQLKIEDPINKIIEEQQRYKFPNEYQLMQQQSIINQNFPQDQYPYQYSIDVLNAIPFDNQPIPYEYYYGPINQEINYDSGLN